MNILVNKTFIRSLANYVTARNRRRPRLRECNQWITYTNSL